MHKYRLPLALLALLVLLGVAYAAWQEQRAEAGAAPDLDALLPELEPEDVARVVVNSPKTGQVVFARKDGELRLREPIESPLNVRARDALIEALTSLEATAIAATKPENHDRLWVGDKRAIALQVYDDEGEKRLDLLVGRYLPASERTMLRVRDQVRVLSVEGWLRNKIEREVEAWRRRVFFGLEPEQVQSVRFTCPGRDLEFVREGEGWKPAEGQPPIADLDAQEVEDRATAVARFRGSGFAPMDLTPDQAGTAGSKRVVEITTTDDPPREFSLRFGGKAGTTKRPDGTDKQMYFVQHDDDPIVYTTSRYLHDWLCPAPADLVEDDEDEKTKKTKKTE